MKRVGKSLFALLLAVSLFVGIASPGAAYAKNVPEQAAPQESAAAETEQQEKNSLKSLIQKQFSNGLAQYQPDDLVTVIVETEDVSVLDLCLDRAVYSSETADVGQLLQQNSEDMAETQQLLQREQQAVKEQIEQACSDADFTGSISYTLLLNAFTVTVPYEALGTIQQLPGVKNAFVSGSFSAPDLIPGVGTYTAYSSDMIGLPAAAAQGYTGKGTVIAILDTGIQYDHEAFATEPESGCYNRQDMGALLDEIGASLNAKIRDGYDYSTWTPIYRNVTADDVWYNDKIVYAFDYAHQDSDATADRSAHGIHVAGIAAGHTVQNGETVFRGVAPDSQLAVMKVFSSYTDSCDTTTLLKALEDCVLLDVDVINMSLGTAAGFTTDISGILTEVMERIEDAGIFLAVAAGNDTSTAANNPLNEAGLAKTNNADFGIVSSPSTYAGALSVASVNNTMMSEVYLYVNDRKILYTDSGTGASSIAAMEGAYQIVSVPGYGAREDYADIDVSGKIALIQRGGEISFQDKITVAWAFGAAGALVYDNEDSAALLTMQLDNYFIPSAFISKADGEYVLAQLANGGATLRVSRDYMEFVEYEDAGQMSSFSSWGPTTTLTIKPEITAPGGNIYSSMDGNTYQSMSGTSMASPQIAGAAAVMIQYLKETQPDTGKAERNRLIKALMMSTADPVLTENQTPAPVRQQGAGLLDLEGALSTETVLWDADGGLPKAELGSSETGSYQFTFTVDNRSNEDQMYSASLNVQTDTVEAQNGNAYFSTIPQDITDGAEIRISAPGGRATADLNGDGAVDTSDAYLIRRYVDGKQALSAQQLLMADLDADGAVTDADALRILRYVAGVDSLPGYAFTVPANSRVTVEVSIRLTAAQVQALKQAFSDGTYIEGFVTLEGLNNVPDLGLPYLGYLGDWDSLSLFDSTVYDGESPAVYDSYLVAVNNTLSGNYLGYNYFTKEFHADRLYFGPHAFDTEGSSWEPASATYLYSEISLMRNASDVTFSVSDSSGVLYTMEYGPSSKTYFYTGEKAFHTTNDMTYMVGYTDPDFAWDLTDGDTLTYSVTATPEGSDKPQTMTFPTVTVDDTAPAVSAEMKYNEETAKFELVLTMSDNEFLQGARLTGLSVDEWGFATEKEIGYVSSDEMANAGRGAVITEVIDVADLQAHLAEEGCIIDTLVVELVDYAWNITTLEVYMEGTHFTTEEKEDGTLSIIRFSGTVTALEIPSEIDGKTVTEIAENAFANLALTEVTLPQTLTTIGAGAFQGCKLSRITIPESVISIGEKAFGYDADGNAIEGFTMRVSAGSAGETYARDNGFAVEYFTGEGLIYQIVDAQVVVLGYEGTEPSLAIPERLQGYPVTEIGYRAFLDNEVLTAVTLPDTLEKIGDRAFMRTNIAGIVIPQSVTTIEEGAFASMENLTSIEIPAGVKELPYMVFANDWNLSSVTFHDGLEKLGDEVFTSCALKEIILPDTVTQIGQACFSYNSTLAKLTLSDALTEIPYAAFANTALSELTLPAGLKSIGACAFQFCSNLTSITIPASVTIIDGGAFEYTGLTSVTFEIGSALQSIGGTAFSGTPLSSIVIPASCTNIGGQAFYMCSSLAEITLQEGLESIGFMAFAGCADTRVFVPGSVTTIGNQALGYIGWSGVVDGFTIEGYTGSAAETYATDNGFAFVAVTDGAQ